LTYGIVVVMYSGLHMGSPPTKAKGPKSETWGRIQNLEAL